MKAMKNVARRLSGRSRAGNRSAAEDTNTPSESTPSEATPSDSEATPSTSSAATASSSRKVMLLHRSALSVIIDEELFDSLSRGPSSSPPASASESMETSGLDAAADAAAAAADAALPTAKKVQKELFFLLQEPGMLWVSDTGEEPPLLEALVRNVENIIPLNHEATLSFDYIAACEAASIVSATTLVGYGVERKGPAKADYRRTITIKFFDRATFNATVGWARFRRLSTRTMMCRHGLAGLASLRAEFIGLGRQVREDYVVHLASNGEVPPNEIKEEAASTLACTASAALAGPKRAEPAMAATEAATSETSNSAAASAAASAEATSSDGAKATSPDSAEGTSSDSAGATNSDNAGAEAANSDGASAEAANSDGASAEAANSDGASAEAVTSTASAALAERLPAERLPAERLPAERLPPAEPTKTMAVPLVVYGPEGGGRTSTVFTWMEAVQKLPADHIAGGRERFNELSGWNGRGPGSSLLRGVKFHPKPDSGFQARGLWAIDDDKYAELPEKSFAHCVLFDTRPAKSSFSTVYGLPFPFGTLILVLDYSEALAAYEDASAHTAADGSFVWAAAPTADAFKSKVGPLLGKEVVTTPRERRGSLARYPPMATVLAKCSSEQIRDKSKVDAVVAWCAQAFDFGHKRVFAMETFVPLSTESVASLRARPGEYSAALSEWEAKASRALLVLEGILGLTAYHEYVVGRRIRDNLKMEKIEVWKRERAAAAQAQEIDAPRPKD